MKGQETQTESLQVTADTCAAGRLLDKFERKARARPKHHQPVPSQYRTWWGYGPEVRGKGGVVWWWEEGKRSIYGPCSNLFWEVRLAGMTDHPKEAI